MTISVFIPTQFKRDYILETLESVYKQTRKPDEVILIKGNNQAQQMNQAVKMSTTDAFIYLADDDRLHSDFIERHEKLMEETGVEVVASALQEIGLRNGVHLTSNYPFMCCLIKKSLWERVGGFPAWPDGQSCVDGEFFHNCHLAGATIAHIEQPLWDYRVHEGQTPITEEQTIELLSRQHEASQRHASLQLPIS